MPAKFRPRSAYDVMAALALFLVIAGGSAYAANTVFSTDIVDGQVKAQDIGAAAVTSKLARRLRRRGQSHRQLVGRHGRPAPSVRARSLPTRCKAADIQDQSGVDTCVLTNRVGQLCVRVENQVRLFHEALGHCGNLDLRLPSLSEAIELVTTHDIITLATRGVLLDWGRVGERRHGTGVDRERGRRPWLRRSRGVPNTFETLCVTTPTIWAALTTERHAGNARARARG